ncbi:hypothetical protein M4D71_00730 [Niallia taxi]|uniref:hypothetical protein n=1 Tax=Niallia taxi TaxID=2499688 RepID=UPI0021A690D8|nr:hypothetical protein [Niallia taxi]MCT2342644.1 hypothetical protein [Niallia taxi]
MFEKMDFKGHQYLVIYQGLSADKDIQLTILDGDEIIEVDDYPYLEVEAMFLKKYADGILVAEALDENK